MTPEQIRQLETTAEPEQPVHEEPQENREFSWYGGKVDETMVREIIRLKREHKSQSNF